MKTKIIVFCVAILTFIALCKLVYKPFVWRNTMNSGAHKLRLGGYIFTEGTKHNGSQSFEKSYTIFKVMDIKDDYVRLAVVRKFYTSKNAHDGYFSADKYTYENAKDSMNNEIVTPVLSADIPDWNDLILNDTLIKKYPNLLKSRLFVEDVSNDIKPTVDSPIYGNKDLFFMNVYSKNEINKNGKLVPYVYGNSVKVNIELMNEYSQSIDLINISTVK